MVAAPNKRNAAKNQKMKINTMNAPNGIKISAQNLGNYNCFFYALGIDIKDSADNLNRKGTFLQVDDFPLMMRNAMRKPKPGQKLCHLVVEEVLKGGLLHHRGLSAPLKLIRRSMPTAGSIGPAWRKLGITPSYYQIAVFVAPDVENRGAGSDFHFARMTKTGKWVHKPGATPMTDKDTDGYPLHPKISAARGRLRVGRDGARYMFCTYLWVCSRRTRYALSKKLQLGAEDALVQALEEDPSGATLD
jgi:hypothetical protein